ncbi:molecular chaperone DnaJ [Marinobacter halodurans]|uniref:Molecular chaperone DnaJ n=1 Tax=Marinobacter halodurans TaxID=2528979 RepID=A0ABY1ZQD9_9GAMM|nr:DNA-J related domain-containing protein [Marinobacter halodurans]TBW59167.1 molecular chaperone DnaJ [Marinobacter halodurans]
MDEPHTQPLADRQHDLEARRAALQQKIAALLVAVEAILREESGGLSELALIRRLQAAPWKLLERVDFSEPSAIYPAHFLVFHCLYRLRDDLGPAGEHLHISPLDIHLTPGHIASNEALPGDQDQLRLFYLDLSQYDLSETAVQQMLDDFWAGRTPTTDSGALNEAARVLGFETLPDDFTLIRQAYRRQAMQAHPDRGGTKEEVQTLNAAFHTLRHHFLSAVGAVR